MAHVPGGQDGPSHPDAGSSFPYLSITAGHDGRRAVLRLKGELDFCNHHELREAISEALEHHPPVFVLDLSELGFMDCSGLSVIIWAHGRLTGRQGQLLIIGSQPIVRRLFCLTGLDTYLRLSAPRAQPGTANGSGTPAPGNPLLLADARPECHSQNG